MPASTPTPSNPLERSDAAHEAELDAALTVLFADNISDLEDPDAFARILGIRSLVGTNHWLELRWAARERLLAEFKTLRVAATRL